MIVPNYNSSCEQAKSHYYDFLYSESSKHIPEFIAEHIEQCQYCQKHINKLKKVIQEAEGDFKQKQLDSAITTMLTLHFAYIGKRVTCQIVKSFLPSMLDTAFMIRIPTPITAHLENCQQCSKDLEALRKLNLNHRQLCRLTQLFAEKKPTKGDISCSQVKAAIPIVVSMAFQETNAEVLKHLCTCHSCQKLLYESRETFREELLQDKDTGNEFPCEEISASDIYDYVIPYGIDPAKDQYAKFRESLTSHLRTCPTCLAKMQQLHKTVYGIAERAESRIATIYYLEEPSKAKTISESDGLYAGLPIRVEIVSGKDEVKTEQTTSTVDFATTLKRVSVKKLKPLLKPAIAAAAIILIAVSSLLNIPTAKAVTIKQIYKAIEKAKNLYIATFTSENQEPIQERWVSRTTNTYLLKTDKESVLWDVGNGLRRSKQNIAGVIDTTPLSSEMAAEIKSIIMGSLGLVPFDDLSLAPDDIEWNPVSDESSQAIVEGIEVYDMTWVERKHGGSIIFKKCRFFIDSKTNLPHRTEFYTKQSFDDDYTLLSVKVVKYLSESEMREVIKKESF